MECPYIDISILGKGDYDTVYKVSSKQNKYVAIKRLGSITELDTLVRINHPNIIHAYDLLDNSGDICPSLEFNYGYTMPIGDMTYGQFLRLNPTIEEVKLVEYQILLGLNFLSKNGILHNDLHNGNILRVDGIWKIIDFGKIKTMVEKDGIGWEVYNFSPKSSDTIANPKDIKDILNIKYFEGIYNKEDLKLGTVIIPNLSLMDNKDNNIGYMINKIIFSRDDHCDMWLYFLIFDICYRYLGNIGMLSEIDINYLYDICNEYYVSDENFITEWEYIKALNYIVVRPTIMDYTNSIDVIQVMGQILINPYEYTKNNLKSMVDEVNIKFNPSKTSKDYKINAYEYSILWFP